MTKHRTPKSRLYVKLQLKICFVALDLQRPHGYDLRRIKSPNEFIAADAQFALPWLDSVILHSPRLVCHSAINPVALHGDRGGDIAHYHQ